MSDRSSGTGPSAPPPTQPVPSRPAEGWEPFDALVGLLAVVFALTLTGTVVSAAVSGDPAEALSLQAAQVAVFIAIPLAYAAIRVPSAPAAALGLRGFRASDLRFVAGALLVQIAVTLAFALVFGAPEQDDVTEDLGFDEGTLAAVSAVILIVLGASISEEILFRGMIFGALRTRLSFWVAAVLAGAVFGAVHLPTGSVEAALLLTVFAVLLAYLYERTGSLGPAIVLHGLNNIIAILPLVT